MTGIRVTVSCLELARVAFPGARVTSGAGQEYLRRLDAVFRPSGFVGLLHLRDWTPDPYLTDLADSGQVFNLTEAESKRVCRAAPPERKAKPRPSRPITCRDCGDSTCERDSPDGETCPDCYARQEEEDMRARDRVARAGGC